MNIAVRGGVIEGEIEIAAPAEAVFDAWTDPLQLAAWWGSEDTYRTFNWQMDLRTGGKWSCEAKSAAGGDTGLVYGVYVEVDRPRRLAFTWNPSWDAGEETLVEITFQEIPAGTIVRLVHSGFRDRDQSRDGHLQGWTRILGWLEQHCQNKETRS